MEASRPLTASEIPLDPVAEGVCLACDSLSGPATAATAGAADGDSACLTRLFAPGDREAAAHAWIEEATEWIVRACDLAPGPDGTKARCAAWRETLHALSFLSGQEYSLATAVEQATASGGRGELGKSVRGRVAMALGSCKTEADRSLVAERLIGGALAMTRAGLREGAVPQDEAWEACFAVEFYLVVRPMLGRPGAGDVLARSAAYLKGKGLHLGALDMTQASEKHHRMPAT